MKTREEIYGFIKSQPWCDEFKGELLSKTGFGLKMYVASQEEDGYDNFFGNIVDTSEDKWKDAMLSFHRFKGR